MGSSSTGLIDPIQPQLKFDKTGLGVSSDKLKLKRKQVERNEIEDKKQLTTLTTKRNEILYSKTVQMDFRTAKNMIEQLEEKDSEAVEEGIIENNQLNEEEQLRKLITHLRTVHLY